MRKSKSIYLQKDNFLCTRTQETKELQVSRNSHFQLGSLGYLTKLSSQIISSNLTYFHTWSEFSQLSHNITFSVPTLHHINPSYFLYVISLSPSKNHLLILTREADLRRPPLAVRLMVRLGLSLSTTGLGIKEHWT